MIYDGYDFSRLLKVENVERSILPDLTVNTADVPGKDGVYFRSVTVGALTLSVQVRMITPAHGLSNQKARFEGLRRELAGRLLKDSPRELIVDDAPDLSYRAVLSGTTNIDRFLYTGGTTLEFLCMNPYGEGRTVKRSASPVQNEEGTEVTPALVRANVGGNYPTAPVVVFAGDKTAYQATFDGGVFSVYGREGAGELVVDCALKRAHQGQYYATVDINCDWPEWEPGVHTVQSGDPFEVSWTERWV